MNNIHICESVSAWSAGGRVLAVLSLCIGLGLGTSIGDARAAGGNAEPFLGKWEGKWVSAMSNQRGGIDIEVTKAEGDTVAGRMAFAGGCGGRYDFTAQVAAGGAVTFSAAMRQPCGKVTVNLHWADDGHDELAGTFKSALDGGDVKLSRDD